MPLINCLCKNKFSLHFYGFLLLFSEELVDTEDGVLTLPQNQNCRKAGKTLVLSSDPNTGVTEGICLPLYTCAPL